MTGKACKGGGNSKIRMNGNCFQDVKTYKDIINKEVAEKILCGNAGKGGKIIIL